MKTYDLFLITPKSYLALMAVESDRERLSKPLPVKLSHSTLDRLLWVNDGTQTFPVNPTNLKRCYQLTNKQKAMIL